jgi:hypothetical protein
VSASPQDRITINVVKGGAVQTEIVVSAPADIAPERLRTLVDEAGRLVGQSRGPTAEDVEAAHRLGVTEGLRIARESGAKWPVDALVRLATLAGAVGIAYRAPEALEADIAVAVSEATRQTARLEAIATRVAQVVDLDEVNLDEAIDGLCSSFGTARDRIAETERAKRNRESLREIDEVLERYDVQTAANVDVSRAELVAGVCEARDEAATERERLRMVLLAVEGALTSLGWDAERCAILARQIIADHRTPRTSTTPDPEPPF